jgi:hypothetical protein
MSHPNLELYKKYVCDFTEYIKLHEIIDLGIFQSEFPNKQDIVILVELKPLLTKRPYFFLLSQRSKKRVELSFGNSVEEVMESIKTGQELDYMVTNVGDMIQI